VPEAIAKYRILAKNVFSERNILGVDGKFKASNLEKAIKDVIEEKLGPGHSEERMFLGSEGCKTYDLSAVSKAIQLISCSQICLCCSSKTCEQRA
jgi:hypothetical protein